MNLTEIYFGITIFPLVLLTIISLYNYFTAPKLLKEKFSKKHSPLVSILIPARNEEKNIEKCIESVLSQTYKNKEIIVLNDHSEDRTGELVFKYKSENVKLIHGRALPSGWLGKNWACHQLSEKAAGEIFLFIDADVILSKYAVESAVSRLAKTNTVMLSVFPTQIFSSVGEYFIVPLMNWLLLNFLPLRFVYSSPIKSFVAANGQFILIEKKAYIDIGGHETVKDKIVEDMEIARELKNKKHRIVTLLGDKIVYCRMYNGLLSSFKGFSKNFFKGFNTSALLFFMFLILVEVLFLITPLLIIINYHFVIAALLILLSRIVISIGSRQNVIVNILLHPIQILLLFIVGLNSVFQSLNSGSEWKGRKIKI